MEKNKVIMAVGAHHDDNELVAGTLARHKADGWKLISVVMTNGVWINGKASPEHTPIREAESLAAAKLLDMETEFLRFPEGHFRADQEATLALTRVIRKHAPDIIITHPPHDYHFDHISTSRCVLDATYISGNICVLPEIPGCRRPALYYSDAWFVPFEPDEYVDIGDLIELKLNMLRCHKSQTPGDPEQTGGMIDLARQQSRTRGIESGVRYAEAFRFVPFLGKVRLSRLLAPG